MPQFAVPLAITAALTSVASAGMSFYGQQQQAAAASRMAQYNYATQKAQMEMQGQIAAQQAMAQGQAAASVANYNASIMKNEALRAEQEAREKARRMREENERLLGTQRAAFGKSGVTSAGSPLMVMADTAGLAELAVADELYKADAQRSGLYTQASLEQYKGRLAMWNAGMEAAGAQWNINNAGAMARPYLLQGMNEAAGLRMSSYGSLISGVGSAASSLASAPWGSGGGGGFSQRFPEFGRYGSQFMPR
jgi:hypothetical protein